MSQSVVLQGVGAWACLGGIWEFESLLGAGFDWLCLDAQHGRWHDAAEQVVLAAPRTEPIVVRTASGRLEEIGRHLDAGADGVIVPLVNTAAEAQAVVQATRYPPRGGRSWGRFQPEHRSDQGDREPFCAVMIETAQAYANVAAIAATPGLDALFVGPFDLALTLGSTVDALVADGTVLAGILAAAHHQGLSAGIYGGEPGRAAEFSRRGFDFTAAGADYLILAAGIKAVLERYRTA